MDDTSETLRKGLAFGGIGFGALAVAAPSAFLATYGLTGSPTTNIFVRLFGTHSLALGSLALTPADTAARRRLFAVTCAMNALDTVVISSAGATPPKSRAAGALTTAAFAGLAGYLASRARA